MGRAKELFMQQRETIQRKTSAHSEFLKSYKLELAVFECELQSVRRILNQLNESYVLQHTEKIDTIMFGEQRYIFYIYCPTTNFAMAFLQLGLLMKSVYRERSERFKKREQLENQSQ